MIGKMLSVLGILSTLGATAAHAQAVYYQTPVYSAPAVVYNTQPTVVYAQPAYVQPTYVQPVYATPYYYAGYPYYPGYYGSGLSLDFNFGGRGYGHDGGGYGHRGGGWR
jgi:hypothetical protein